MDEMPRVDQRRLTRWLDETREVMGLLPGLVDRLVALEQECERLRQEGGRLRQENALLRAERTEISDALHRAVQTMTEPLSELVQRLRAA